MHVRPVASVANCGQQYSAVYFTFTYLPSQQQIASLFVFAAVAHLEIDEGVIC